MKMFATLLLVTACALPSQAADLDAVAKDIVGGWQLEFTSPDDVHRTPIVIVGRQLDELVAWYVENGQPEPFKDVKLVGESLRMTR